MIIKELKLEHYGKFKEVKVNFDPRITYLIGPNGSSKSTLGLYGIWFVLQGIAEKAQKGQSPIIGERFRFIHNDYTAAKGSLVLFDKVSNDEITITRKITKDGNTVKIESKNGRALDQNWLNELFNVFMLSPKRFYTLTPEEQTKALGIDLTEFQNKMKELKTKYTEINANVRMMADIQVSSEEDFKPIPERVNIEAIKQKTLNLHKENEAIVLHNQGIDKYYENRKKAGEGIKDCDGAITEYERQIKELESKIADVQLRRKQFELEYEKYSSDPEPKKELISGQSIQEELEEALKTNQEIEKIEIWNKQAKTKLQLLSDLTNNKLRQEMEIVNKNDYLASIDLKVKDLEINENGQLTFRNRFIQEPFFSTGELIKICISLIARTQARKPEEDALRYVFIQDWELLDEENQKSIQLLLAKYKFQVVIEHVGHDAIENQFCILLSEINNDGTES